MQKNLRTAIFVIVGIIVLALVAYAAVTMRSAPDTGSSPTPGNTFGREEMTSDECTARNGKFVQKSGLSGGFAVCALPYADGGESCTSSDQCDGRCLMGAWSPNPQTADSVPNDAAGTCEEYDISPNCQYTIELLGNGKSRRAGSCEIG
jgi:hypothetical protein